MSIEPLEPRELLATAGTDFVIGPGAWPNPSHLTYSIAPDGVFWDHGTNDLNAVFDAKFGAGVWEREIARALATWEAAANLEIAQVADSVNDLDTIGQAQGDPRFGDIRFGGYAFTNTTTTLAQTYFPPPNGWTAAGDVEVNTAMDYHIGSNYDLYSVMLHETGHSLGLDHPSDPGEVMYAIYQGIRAGLSPGDSAGIQTIYGARQPDTYQAKGQGQAFNNAVDVTSQLNTSGQALVSGVSLATIGDTEYFSVVVPAGASGGLHVSACANGISLLSPLVSLFDASGKLIASQSNPSAWCDNVTASTSGVVPGQRYYLAVTGATSDSFAVGAYALRVAFDGVTPAPSSPSGPGTTTPPPTSTPGNPAIPPDRFEPNNSLASATPLGVVSQTVVSGLNLNTASDVDDFSFRTAGSGVFVVGAAGTTVQVLDVRGHLLAQGAGQTVIRVARAHTLLYVQVRSTNGSAVAGYSLSISYTPPASRSKTRAPRRELAATPVVTTTPALRNVPGGPAAVASWRGHVGRR